MKPMQSPQMLNELHPELKQLGWKLLQPYRYGDTDSDHAKRLLEMAKFPNNARVLDVGCGVGECSKLMKEHRPDIDFVLLNFSFAQLNDCPEGFEKHLGDSHDLKFEDESFDGVMFNASLGNMDYQVALAEAARVLKVGGVLFLNEPKRVSGTNDAMIDMISFQAISDEDLTDFSEQIGLVKTDDYEIKSYVEYLKSEWDEDSYDKAFEGVIPGVLRFEKKENTIASKVGSTIGRHKNIALHVSGGKDSLSVLHSLKPWWNRLKVYWLNTGDPVPATEEMMKGIKNLVPEFIEVKGNQPEVIRMYGWPSDVVPQSHTILGNQILGKTSFMVQERLHCCFNSIMLPMHQRMIQDGVTLVIRGKRGDDADKTGVKSGQVEEYEVLFPIIDWTEKDVYIYLDKNAIELPEYYEYVSDSLDCKTCTAWSEHGANRYLKESLPEAYAEKSRRQKLILDVVKNTTEIVMGELA